MEDRDNPILRDLLEKAAELPPAQRAGFLDGACGGDQKLRAEVDALLASLEQADGFLDNPTFKRDGTGPAAAPTADASAVERAGSRVGRYKLLQLIGEGGFGTVFMAEQEHPVRRRVAFKIIKPGMDSAAVIARFEAERQALAMMEHPNIARVYDAGTTDAGRPYFVMELVQGIPITRYCDSKRLTPRQRMELFIPVCRAIQHAHQKGVIHRDLKPSNVLVMTCDAQPVPKVIDFGVAKALHQRLTERTLFTQFGHAIGTPEYMSPEQADMDVVGADTRSDVYSLGVLLYELLTGVTPLDGKTLREAGYARMLQLIREQEPPRPSTRLASSGEALASISADRGTAPAELTRLTRGDLDWIVMKCLEKDRARRYASADGLARDIERYLSDEPVEASPPSRAHKFRRFVRKHRVPLVVAAAFVAVLLGATAFSIRQAVRATQARTASEADKRRADEQAAVAREQAAVAQAVNDFLDKDLLSQVSARRQDAKVVTPVADLTVREALDRATTRMRDRFKGQPRVEAQIRHTIGVAYKDLGILEKAEPQLEAALELSRQSAGTDSVDTLAAMLSVASLRRLQSRLPEAEVLYKKALDFCRKRWGDDHAETLDVQLHLATIYLGEHRPSEAEPLIRHAIEVRSKRLGPNHADVINSVEMLANLFSEKGDYAKAEPLLRQAIENHRSVSGEMDPITLGAKRALANNLMIQHKYAAAEPLFVEAAKGLRQELGERSGDAMEAEYDLGLLYLIMGEFNKAEPPLREVSGLILEGKGDKQGGKMPLLRINRLIVCYQRLGEWDKAADWQRRLFEVLGPQLSRQIGEKTEALKRDPENLSLLRQRGDLCGRLGRFREAASDYSKVLNAGPEDYQAWWLGLSLLLESGDADGYRQRRTEALRRFANSNGDPAHRIVKCCMISPLGDEESQAALKLADRVLAAPSPNPWFFQTKGMAEYRCGRYEQAVIWLNRSDGDQSKNWLNTIDWRQAENGCFLAMSYWKLGQADQARSALSRAADFIDVRLPKPGENDLNDWFQDWILCHAVRREAEEMIGKPPAVPAAAPGPETRPLPSK